MGKPNAPAERPAHIHVVRGSVWTVGLRWSIRGTGLISTLVLARLLKPWDFGIVAIAMLVVGALEVFSETGQKMALIRHPAPTREHYDSAWTVSILIGFVLGLTILAVAPLSVYYFHEPRTVPVIECLALRAMISGFENIGVVDFRKELNFSRDFHYNFIQKIVSLIVTITLAFILRNYWALVAGILTSRILGVCLSYWLHPFRPRISFSKVREIWGFSTWLLVKHVGNYLHAKVDEFVVGGMAGTAWMGRYNVAADLATAPTQEIAGPMVATLWPVMAKYQSDPAQMKELYLRVLYWSCVISASTAVGVALVAPEMVPLVLGPQWVDVDDLISWLALGAGVTGITGNTYTLFEVLGHARISARLQWARVISLTVALIPVAVFLGSVHAIAVTRMILTLFMTPMLLIAVTRLLPITLGETLRAIWRPLAAAAMMAVAVQPVSLLPADDIVLRLILKVAAGATAYLGALYLLWFVAGRPAGLEEEILRWTLGAIDRMKRAKGQTVATVESSGRNALNIYLYVPVSISEEFIPAARSIPGSVLAALKRLRDRIRWRLEKGTTFDLAAWQRTQYTNRGDIAIRESIVELLTAGLQNRRIVFHQLSWGALTAEMVETINANASLFVICGGGYVFLDENGFPSNSRLTDVKLLASIACPIAAFGIGANSLLTRKSINLDAPLPLPTTDLLRQLINSCATISVRGGVLADQLQQLTRQKIYLTGDPALFLGGEPDLALHRRKRPAARLRIGINCSLHGPGSATVFRRSFPTLLDLMRRAKLQHDVEFVYFVHCDTEAIPIGMIRAKGFALTVVRTHSPWEMIEAYREVDFVICQMLHSAILATNAGTPSLTIAYDLKNFTFYRLFGLTEFCLSPNCSREDAANALATLIDRREEIGDHLRERLGELWQECQEFLAKTTDAAVSYHYEHFEAGPVSAQLLSV